MSEKDGVIRQGWGRISGSVLGITGIALLLVNLVFLLPADCSQKRLLKLAIYHSDFRHWPKTYSDVLWIVASGTVLCAVLRSTSVGRFVQAGLRRTSPSGIGTLSPKYYPGIMAFSTLLILSVYLLFLWWTPAQIARTLYYRVYVAYCSGPLTELLYDGRFSFKIFTFPVVGLLIVAVLLLIRKRTKGGTS